MAFFFLISNIYSILAHGITCYHCDGLDDPKTCKETMQCAAGEVTYCILSLENVPGEIYFRNSSCVLNLISTVLLDIIAKKDWTETNDVNT